MVETRNKKTIPSVLHWFPLICLAILSKKPCYGQELPNGKDLAYIADGTPAPPGRFPYMCSIRRRGLRNHVCGGMLVASNWVLTSAHCLDPNDVRSAGKTPLIYCGIHDRDERDSTKTYGTTKCHLHHLWTGNVLDGNDIALCKLDRASSVATPDMVNSGDAFGKFDRFTVLGWGHTATKPLAEELQIGSDLRFFPESSCNDFEDWKGRITKSMICAGFNDPGTCRGDSGGPLLVADEDQDSVVLGDSSRDLIVGITSFGDPSCDKLIPGVYTRVSCYRAWINCIMGGTADDCGVHRPCGETASGCSDVSRSASLDETAAIQRIKTAIDIDDPTTVEKILCQGLDPNVTIGDLGDTLLHLAARNDAIESAKVLLQYGAAVDGSGSDSIMSRISVFGFYDAPLHAAAEYGSSRVAELLIDNGANTKIRDRVRYTALHHAARVNSPALIDAGAEVENAIPRDPFPSFQGSNPVLVPQSFGNVSTARVDNENDGGWTALHVTARFNSSDVTKVLLDSGAGIESRTDSGSSALHIAAMSAAYDVAKMLIARGADAKGKDKSDWTPLHFAAQSNSLLIAKALDAVGANKEAKTTSGNDPLMIASYHGSLTVVKFLLNGSVTLGSVNNDGDTPLHLAASRGHASVVEALLEAGESKLITNNKGETAFDNICSPPPQNGCLLASILDLQQLLTVD